MIRKMQLEDVARVAQIQVLGWRNAFRGIVDDDYLFNTMSVEKSTDAIKRELTEKDCGSFYVFDDGIIKGFIIFDILNDGEIFELRAIYCDPSMKKQGVGSALLNYFEEPAKQCGFNQVSLWVFEKNLDSIKFYEKMGYKTNNTKRQLKQFNQVFQLQYTKEL
ncbi:MAG: GNAT family N-acetyltransferase [Firmicutes bacterium]|nr:GNAT family N-acetyltransferase [Bacillota bacterium]